MCSVALIPFNPAIHSDRLAIWLSAPHVTEWWGDPQAQLTACLVRPVGGDDALITASGHPVGYVRWQQPPRPELDAAGLSDLPHGVLDIDIAIGEPSQLGHGIGSAALRLLVAQLRRSDPLQPIVMATSATNRRALRAFERAGFLQVRAFEDPEYGTSVLLRYPVLSLRIHDSEEIDA